VFNSNYAFLLVFNSNYSYRWLMNVTELWHCLSHGVQLTVWLSCMKCQEELVNISLLLVKSGTLQN